MRKNDLSGRAAAFLAGVLAAILIVTLVFGGVSPLLASLKYASLLRIVRTRFIGDYDVGEVTDGALAGAVQSLDDHWSYYMDAETYAAYQDYSANVYQGIGVTISQDEESGGFLIVSVTKDGPAQRAGIAAGDIILAVDGESVVGGDTGDVRTLVQADYGGTAVVTVLREDGSTEDIPVSCEVVFSSPVRYEMLDGGVGYIDIDNFRDGAAAESVAAIETLVDEGASALVFDVRSNPGGQLTELVALLDYLLPEGVVFIRSDKAGHESVETSDASCVELPMAVLVNGDSYSAAEFFAAALREYEWATVVGEATTGKSRSQVTYPLADGSAVHISQFAYLTPNRVDLYETGGIVPDVEIALSDEDRLLFDTGWLTSGQDLQIQAAIDELRA